MWRRWWIVAGLAVLLASCGGEEAETGARSRVTATDGTAFLVVPDGALPDGVDPGSLSVERIDASEVFEGDPTEIAGAYRLAPDGLVFSKSARLEVPISLEHGQVVQVMSLSDTPELLSGITLDGYDDAADGAQDVTLQVPVHHFSDIVIRVWSAPDGILVVEPDPVGDHPVGTSFEPTATATLGEPVVKVDETRWHYGDRDFVQSVEVRAGTDTWTSQFNSLDIAGPLEPSVVGAYLEGYDGPARRSYTVRATSPLWCREPGDFVLNWEIIGRVEIDVTITQTWEDTGEEFYRLSERYRTRWQVPGMAGGTPTARGEGIVTGDCLPSDTTATTSGGDGTVSSVSIEGGVVAAGSDPTGDFTGEEALAGRGFELVEGDPPAGMDITDVEVVYAPGGDRTVVTVQFAGSFRALEEQDGRSASIRPIFRIDGQYGFEIEYRAGSAYVSGGPEGTTVAFEWLSDDTIRFTLDGHTPSPGDAVRVVVFSRLETTDGTAVVEDEATVDITE